MVQGIASINANQQPQSQLPPVAQASLGKGLSSLTPEEISGLRELSDDLKELSPEKLQVLSQIIAFLKKNAGNYDKAVQSLVVKKVVEPGDLPPHYIPAFFEILDNMVKEAMSGAPQKFARGGIAQIKKQAKSIEKQGTGGDKMLAHINPREAAFLAATRGGGTNPKTGLPEFGFFDDVGNFLKQAAGVVLPVALGFMGVPPIFAGAIGSGVGALINGASPGQALGAAALGGLGGALFSGVSGAMSGTGFMNGVSAGFQPANAGPLSGMFGSQQAAAGAEVPTSLGTPYTPSQIAGQMGRGAMSPTTPGVMSSIGNWISSNPVPAVGIAGLGGALLGSSMSSGSGNTTSTASMPTGPTAAQVAAARFAPGTFTQYTAPKVNVTPYFSTYQPYTGVYAATGGEIDARIGGHLRGPGTGTSDSIPAKLSDGEFVMTAKAVKGAGGGNREAGAKKMYQLMHQFEKGA